MSFIWSRVKRRIFSPSRRHPYYQWAFENRRLGSISAGDARYAPPDYVILWKLEFFREGGGDKHVRDIRGMLLVNGESVDQKMIDRAVAELGLETQCSVVRQGLR